jgi:hypothetical protein
MGTGSVERSAIAAARYQPLWFGALAWLDWHGISVAGLWAEHLTARSNSARVLAH